MIIASNPLPEKYIGIVNRIDGENYYCKYWAHNKWKPEAEQYTSAPIILAPNELSEWME